MILKEEPRGVSFDLDNSQNEKSLHHIYYYSSSSSIYLLGK